MLFWRRRGAHGKVFKNHDIDAGVGPPKIFGSIVDLFITPHWQCVAIGSIHFLGRQ